MKAITPILVALTYSLFSSLATPAFASESFKLGEVKYAGNGCPGTSTTEHSTVVRMNENALSIILTEMTLLTPAGERSLQRKKCDIALAVSVESGYQIRIVNTKLQAFIALDTTSTASITVESGFTGEAFTKDSEKYSADFTDNVTLAIDETPWSECGKDVIVRSKASMILRSDQTQNAYMRVNGVSFEIEAQACSVET